MSTPELPDWTDVIRRCGEELPAWLVAHVRTSGATARGRLVEMLRDADPPEDSSEPEDFVGAHAVTLLAEFEPDDALTLVNRGNTYSRLREDDKALADYAEALRLEPANARAFNARGNLHAERGDLEGVPVGEGPAAGVDLGVQPGADQVAHASVVAVG